MSRDTLDLKLNVKWNLSNIDTDCNYAQHFGFWSRFNAEWKLPNIHTRFKFAPTSHTINSSPILYRRSWPPPPDQIPKLDVIASNLRTRDWSKLGGLPHPCWWSNAPFLKLIYVYLKTLLTPPKPPWSESIHISERLACAMQSCNPHKNPGNEGIVRPSVPWWVMPVCRTLSLLTWRGRRIS